MMVYGFFFVVLLRLVALVSADSLKDVEHVVLFLQENRAFDHVTIRSPCCFGLPLRDSSISEPWLVFADSPILMSKLILMARQFSNSPSDIFYLLNVKVICDRLVFMGPDIYYPQKSRVEPDNC